MSERTDQICALNDQLRQTLATGLVVITPGVAALGPVPVERIVKTVSVYDDFCRANDPHEEHDLLDDLQASAWAKRTITSR